MTRTNKLNKWCSHWMSSCLWQHPCKAEIIITLLFFYVNKNLSFNFSFKMKKVAFLELMLRSNSNNKCINKHVIAVLWKHKFHRRPRKYLIFCSVRGGKNMQKTPKQVEKLSSPGLFDIKICPASLRDLHVQVSLINCEILSIIFMFFFKNKRGVSVILRS